MKTKEEIMKKIEETESDERYNYPPAQVQINAPLALIQVSMKSRVDAWKWVLKEGEGHDRENDSDS